MARRVTIARRVTSAGRKTVARANQNNYKLLVISLILVAIVTFLVKALF